MFIRSVRIFFIVLCMITGGILGGIYARDIKASISKMAQWGVQRNEPDVTFEQPQPPADSTGARTERRPDEKIEIMAPPSMVEVLGCIAAGILLGLLFATETLRLLTIAVRRLDEMEPEETIATVAGIILGLVITGVFIPILREARAAFPLLLIVAGIIFIYLGITAANRVVGILPTAGGKGPVRRKAIKILDTNVIIDGRIAEIMRTGFMEGQIYVPRFVLDELQLIADSSDQLKRARGRRGLEILNGMQKEFTLDVGTHDRNAPETADGVDARLVRLAKAIGGDIVTNDYNLNKVAELQGIKVLNVNDLALALKPNVLPGEEMTVMIIREGKEANQGVAYLDDGTMVVVEGGRRSIGNATRVVVTSVLQTTAGKMIFADIRDQEGGEDDNAIDQSVRAFTRGRSRRPLR